MRRLPGAASAGGAVWEPFLTRLPGSPPPPGPCAFWGFPVALGVRCGCGGGDALRLFPILEQSVALYGKEVAVYWWPFSGGGGEGWSCRASVPGVGPTRMGSVHGAVDWGRSVASKQVTGAFQRSNLMSLWGHGSPFTVCNNWFNPFSASLTPL